MAGIPSIYLGVHSRSNVVIGLRRYTCERIENQEDRGVQAHSFCADKSTARVDYAKG